MTTYSDIYDRFLNKITDYDLLDLAINNAIQFESELLKHLKSSIVKFGYCRKDLSDRDDANQQFNISLNETEQEILATYMGVSWLSPKILREDTIRQSIGSSDYKLYSPANLIDKLTSLKSHLVEEADKLSVFYYYSDDEE